MNERKVTQIPVRDEFPRLHRVGVYCRVSTYNIDHLRSMAVQVSHLARTVLHSRNWILIGIYLDFHSGLDDHRPELQRLIEDYINGVVDTVLTKSVSRFRRDTELIITLISAYAQEESFNRSENILCGIEKGMEDGTSKLYNRRCFEYQRNKEGLLEICPEEAEIVRLIFDLYLEENSILAIVRELERREILTPAGKKKWCNQSVVKILTNEKYIGNVLLKKTYTEGFPNRKRKRNFGEKHQYLAEPVHPEIISKEIFDAVQTERQRRSNVIVDENVVKKRARKRYTSKVPKEDAN